MCDIDLEPCEVWDETPRVARKPHKCSSCGATIAVGERYIAHFSVFEGDRTTEKACAACEADRDTFAAAHGGTRCPPSGFSDMVHECIAEDDEESEQVWRPMLDRIAARRDAARGGRT